MAIAIGLIAISTTILSAFSYVHWVGGKNLVDEALVQSIRSVAQGCVTRIEQKIIDNDGVLSEMIDVNEPSTWEATASGSSINGTECEEPAPC